jgi:hypothetical protein
LLPRPRANAFLKFHQTLPDVGVTSKSEKISQCEIVTGNTENQETGVLREGTRRKAKVYVKRSAQSRIRGKRSTSLFQNFLRNPLLSTSGSADDKQRDVTSKPFRDFRQEQSVK